MKNNDIQNDMKKPSRKVGSIRLLKLWEILQRETDEDHPMSTNKLISKLDRLNISCDRRTLESDIATLNELGYEVLHDRKQSNEYYVMERTFDIPEIQVLLDAVQAASFITEKKTAVLIDKIARLAGNKRAEVLRQNTVEFHTPKSNNESINYIINEIVNAITNRKQIGFLYFDYDINHNRVYRKDKQLYVVNPLSTIFSNDNYYLMCYDDKHGDMSAYRVDRMDNVTMTDVPIRETEKSKSFDVSRHKRQLFGMFSGEGERVSLKADASLIDYIFDKFGDDVSLARDGDKLLFSAEVQVSPAFIAWCCSFGDKLKVVSPQNVIDKVKDFLTNTLSAYSE